MNVPQCGTAQTPKSSPAWILYFWGCIWAKLALMTFFSLLKFDFKIDSLFWLDSLAAHFLLPSKITKLASTPVFPFLWMALLSSR